VKYYGKIQSFTMLWRFSVPLTYEKDMIQHFNRASLANFLQDSTAFGKEYIKLEFGN